MIKKIIRSKIFIVIAAILIFLFVLSFDYSSDKNQIAVRGVSFTKMRAESLGLNWKQVYQSVLDDLGVKNLRIAAHWDVVEAQRDKFDFSVIDYQISEAQKRNASVILAIGRRVPGWPECHIPTWAKDLSIEEYRNQVLELVEATVNRYKEYDNIKYWQVENEPFLAYFNHDACGDLDEELLKKEISLVKSLDPDRKILITDSGEFGDWIRAYKLGDVFGTSQYLYIWIKKYDLPFKYPIDSWFFKIKKNIVQSLFGTKPIIAIEISSEPWLLKPIIDTPIETQLDRMDLNKFNEMIKLSEDSGFKEQYYWGAEWWYWMKQNNHPEFWLRAKELFSHN